MLVRNTICYLGSIKIIRAYCVGKIHNGYTICYCDSIKIMGEYCVGRVHVHNMLPCQY